MTSGTSEIGARLTIPRMSRYPVMNSKVVKHPSSQEVRVNQGSKFALWYGGQLLTTALSPDRRLGLRYIHTMRGIHGDDTGWHGSGGSNYCTPVDSSWGRSGEPNRCAHFGGPTASTRWCLRCWERGVRWRTCARASGGVRWRYRPLRQCSWVRCRNE